MYTKCVQDAKILPIVIVKVEIKWTVHAKMCTFSSLLPTLTGLPGPPTAALSSPLKIGML